MTERIFKSEIEALLGEVLVVAGVLAQHRLLLAEHVVNDRPADARRDLVLGYGSIERRTLLGAVLESLTHQSLARGILQHQEEPLGTGKDLHQGVEDLGGDGVDPQLVGETSGDLEDRFELHLGTNRAGHRARARGFECEEVRIFRAVALGDHHEVGGGFWILRLGRLDGVVDELDAADADPVVLLQKMLDTALQLGGVDERLVPRVEIDQEEGRPDFADLGMPPAHSVGSQNDVALRQATDHRHVAFQINQRTGKVSGHLLQDRHLTLLRHYMVLGTEGG